MFAVSIVTRDKERRRYKLRFPFVAILAYTYHTSRELRRGTGVTVNISRNGLLFRADQQLAVGRPIHLSLGWPVKLEEKVGLNLIMHGRVVRTQDNYVAVEFRRYEFRTRASCQSGLCPGLDY